MSLYDHAALKADPACAPMTRLDEVGDRIRNLIGIVSETNSSLNTAADRVFGQQPPQASGAATAPSMGLGALSSIHDLLDSMCEAVRANADQAGRFGAL